MKSKRGLGKLWALAFLLILLLITTCDGDAISTDRDKMLARAEIDVETINDNSNFGTINGEECQLLAKPDQNAMAGSSYYLDNNYGTYNYAEYDDGVCITLVTLENPVLNVFGISVGDSIQRADEILPDKGYDGGKTTFTLGNYTVQYTKGFVGISFIVSDETDTAEITKITVYVNDTAHNGVAY